eukprot:PhM_4_TR5690/c0_g2_i1/m.18285
MGCVPSRPRVRRIPRSARERTAPPTVPDSSSQEDLLSDSYNATNMFPLPAGALLQHQRSSSRNVGSDTDSSASEVLWSSTGQGQLPFVPIQQMPSGNTIATSSYRGAGPLTNSSNNINMSASNNINNFYSASSSAASTPRSVRSQQQTSPMAPHRFIVSPFASSPQARTDAWSIHATATTAVTGEDGLAPRAPSQLLSTTESDDVVAFTRHGSDPFVNAGTIEVIPATPILTTPPSLPHFPPTPTHRVTRSSTTSTTSGSGNSGSTSASGTLTVTGTGRRGRISSTSSRGSTGSHRGRSHSFDDPPPGSSTAANAGAADDPTPPSGTSPTSTRGGAASTVRRGSVGSSPGLFGAFPTFTSHSSSESISCGAGAGGGGGSPTAHRDSVSLPTLPSISVGSVVSPFHVSGTGRQGRINSITSSSTGSPKASPS